MTRNWSLPLVTCGLLAASCHSPSRDNPLDAGLTPPVLLQPARVDSVHGTVELRWSPYEGDQPFAAYRIGRRVIGEAQGQVRGTLESAQDTVFTDAGLQADVGYLYTVSVINDAGLVVDSKTEEVTFSFGAARIVDVTFDEDTATARVRWTRAPSGLQRYEVLRQTVRDAGPVVVHQSPSIDDTTFTDAGLAGGLMYTYTVVTRSSTGRELTSAAVSGCIYPLIGHWEHQVPERGSIVTCATYRPDGDLVVDISSNFSYLDTLPALPKADRIYRFSSDGELVGVSTPEPDAAPPFFRADDIAAADGGLYLLMRRPESVLSSPDLVEGHVLAVMPSGEARFRWPATGEEPNLTALAIDPGGDLWVAQSVPAHSEQEDQLRLHRLDPSDGSTRDRFEIPSSTQPPIFPGSLTIGEDVGAYYGEGILLFRPADGSLVEGGPSGLGVEDVAFGQRNRLFVLRADPHSLEVWRDGLELVTDWDVEPEGTPILLPIRLAVDPAGRVTVVEIGVRTWSYGN